MMKKTAFVLTACLLAGLCTACGGAGSSPADEPVPAETTAAAPAETTVPAETTISAEAAPPAESVSDSITFKAGDYHAKAGDKHFPVTIEVENCPGLSMLGLRVHYDGALSPCMEGDDKLKIEYEDGPMSGALMMTHAANTKDHVLGFAGFAAGMGTGSPEGTGKLVTCYFDIPADAKPGTKYELRPEPVNVLNIDKKELSAEVAIGYITIDE